MSTSAVSYKRHRFPLSFRLIEEMLLERGIVISYETIRRWSLKFGAEYVRSLCGKRANLWHLDEVRIVIGGQIHWLWRAVDQDGYILDEILQQRRNTKAAKRLLTRLLRKQGVCPWRMITDKLKSYGAAKRKLCLSVRHLSHKGLNNRAENSHYRFENGNRPCKDSVLPADVRGF